MDRSEVFIKTVIKKVSARVGKKIVEKSVDIFLTIQDTPNKIRNEWESLKDEISEEIEELNNNSKHNEDQTNESATYNSDKKDPIEKIDILREKIDKANKLL